MDEELFEVRATLRRLRAAKRKRDHRSDERTGLTLHTMHVAVCIGLLCDCDMRAGVAWLESAQRRANHWRDDLRSDDVLLRLRVFFIWNICIYSSNF